MERLEYFRNWRKYASEIKNIISEMVEADVYVFGSVIKGEYSIGLSDIDIAIVSDKFRDRRLRLKIYDILLEKYQDTPFQFHIITPERWNYMLRFINKDYIKI